MKNSYRYYILFTVKIYLGMTTLINMFVKADRPDEFKVLVKAAIRKIEKNWESDVNNIGALLEIFHGIIKKGSVARIADKLKIDKGLLNGFLFSGRPIDSKRSDVILKPAMKHLYSSLGLAGQKRELIDSFVKIAIGHEHGWSGFLHMTIKSEEAKETSEFLELFNWKKMYDQENNVMRMADFFNIEDPDRAEDVEAFGYKVASVLENNNNKHLNKQEERITDKVKYLEPLNKGMDTATLREKVIEDDKNFGFEHFTDISGVRTFRTFCQTFTQLMMNTNILRLINNKEAQIELFFRDKGINKFAHL